MSATVRQQFVSVESSDIAQDLQCQGADENAWNCADVESWKAFRSSIGCELIICFLLLFYCFIPPPNVVTPETYCFLSCSPMRAWVRPSVQPWEHPKTLLTGYLAEYLTHFHETYNALWVRDERFTVWGQRVKGQGHGGIVCWKQHFQGLLTRCLEKY